MGIVRMDLRSNLTFALLGIRQGSNSVRRYGPEPVHKYPVLNLGQYLHQEFALVHHGGLGWRTSYQLCISYFFYDVRFFLELFVNQECGSTCSVDH